LSVDGKPAGDKNKLQDDVSAKISDEDVARAKRQIGVAVPLRAETHSPRASVATMRNFTWGYGDDNPLYMDEKYAETSRWRGLISAPMYPIATGVCETPALEGEKKALFKGLFRGVGKYYSGVRWEWFQPIRTNQKTFVDFSTSDVEIKTSSFSGGRSVIETYRIMHVDESGSPVAVRYESYVSAERGGSKKAGKHANTQRAHYDDKDIAEIDARYAAEERRGDNPRYFEDVHEGDELVPVVKGPLTVTDVISQHVGWGMGEYGIGPLRYSWSARKGKLPGFYNRDEYGVPDVMQRMHWDPEWAKAIGLPAPYDYGQMRSCWMTHLLCNWMGDDAWLAGMSNRLNSFNFLGDTHVLTGRVIEKAYKEGRCTVIIEVAGVNQRGIETVTGAAEILLPSREFGPVVLPEPSLVLRQRGAKMMALRGQDEPLL
jgi:acyl dehydratase